MRKQIIELIILTVLLAAAPAVHGQQYTIVDLGALTGHDSSSGHAVNNKGQVAGMSYSRDGSGGGHAFLHANGVMTNLGTLGGDFSGALANYSNADFMGINDNGQVIGTSLLPAGDGTYYWRAFVYQSGTMTDLGTLGGFNSFGSAINSSGQMTGQANLPLDSDPPHNPGPSHAFLYSDGVMTDLGALPGSNSSYGYGISDDGRVVGGCSNGYTGRAFLYADGVMTDLGTLPGGLSSEAYGISPNGRLVTGISQDAENTGIIHAFLYTNGVMADLGLGWANGVNDDGDVVGRNWYGDVLHGSYHAVLYTDNTVVRLQDLLPEDSGWNSLQSAIAINNRGQITGWGTNSNGLQRAFLMSPPEESSGCVLENLVESSLKSGQQAVKSLLPSVKLPFPLSSLNSLLTSARGFRDNVLRATPEGKKLVDAYYAHSPELWGLVRNRPDLMPEILQLVVDLHPAFVAADVNGTAAITPTQWDRGWGLIAKLQVQASPELRNELAQLRSFLQERRTVQGGQVLISLKSVDQQPIIAVSSLAQPTVAAWKSGLSLSSLFVAGLEIAGTCGIGRMRRWRASFVRLPWNSRPILFTEQRLAITLRSP